MSSEGKNGGAEPVCRLGVEEDCLARVWGRCVDVGAERVEGGGDACEARNKSVVLGLYGVSVREWADYAAAVEGKGIVKEGFDAAVDF